MGSSTHHPRKLRTKTQTPPRATVPAYRGRRRWPSCHDQVCCSPKSPRKGVWIPRLVPARPSPPQNEESEQNFHRGNEGAPVSLCLSSSDPPWPLTQRGGWGWGPSGEGLTSPWKGQAEPWGACWAQLSRERPAREQTSQTMSVSSWLPPNVCACPAFPAAPVLLRHGRQGTPETSRWAPCPPRLLLR